MIKSYAGESNYVVTVLISVIDLEKKMFLLTPYPEYIKATHPLERLKLDFKGPLPSSSKNMYILTIIDVLTFSFCFCLS